MAHLFGRSSSSVGSRLNIFKHRPSGKSASRHALSFFAAALAALTCFTANGQTSSYVPAVIASSVGPVPTTPYKLPLTGSQTNLGGGSNVTSGPTNVAVDACGNIYAIDHSYDGNAPITEIPAGGGPATVAYTVGNSYGVIMGQDASHTHLIVGSPYNTGVNLIPLVNCVPQPSQTSKVGGGNGALFYYYNPGYSAGDFAGNTYITTNGTCCVTGNYYLVQESGGTGNILLSNQANELQSLAIDKLQNIYFITGAAVFELPYSGGKYAAAPVPYGKYLNPVGLSVDNAGNLYVADSSAAAVYEIPFETITTTNSSGTTTTTTELNLADQFTVSSGLSINVAVAVNARGDMYYTAAGAKSISELTLGNANFTTVALGQLATRVLNFQFNAEATLTGIQAPGGDFSIQTPNPGTTACTVSGVYTPTTTSFTGTTVAGSESVTQVSSTTGLIVGQGVSGTGIPAGTTITSIGGSSITISAKATASGTTSLVAGNTSCQITVGFTPASVGAASSAVVLTYTTAGPADKSGNPTTITSTITAYLEGIGQGALLTLDPGTPSAIDTGVGSPAEIAVDRAGNTYIADPGSNSVLEYPAGGGAAVPVSVSGLKTPLSAPLGVAVDGGGDVFIADTGNNRVVEVPYLNGALSPAASTVIDSALKNPSYVFVHTNGDLYVADTGDNTVAVYPSFNGPNNAGASFGPPTHLGVGLSAPLAVTVDGPGNVFIADSGNNQILEFPLGGGQEIVAADILNPSGLATDSSGSLFVVDQGNYRVLRIPSVGGTLSPNNAAEVALGVANPYGVAIDAASNLYVTDKTVGAVYSIARSQTGLAFGDLAVGTPSTALPLTVESAGNVPLVFNTPYFTETGNSADFAMTSPTGACADALTLVTGGSCDLTTTFTPSAAGARSATVAFSSSAANAPQVVLSGTGVSPSPTTTTLALVTSVAGAPFYGEPLTFNATVAPTSGSASPTGAVSFVLDGTQIALLPVVKGVATLPLNSGLTGGSHTIYAVYKGDTANNGSSSAVQTVTIAKAPTTATLVITNIPYVNPYSLPHSNAGSCNVTDTLGHTNDFPAIADPGIAFTASVSSPGVGVPSGTLTFYSDGKPINGAQPSAPALSLMAGGGFPNNQTVYVVLTLTNVYGETAAGPSANITTSATNGSVSVSLANSYGPAATGVNIYEADVPSGSPAPTVYHLVGSYGLGTSATITATATKSQTPPATDKGSMTQLTPVSGGGFSGNMASDANTLGDGTLLGENNVLLGGHVITVVYSGDQNYLPSTSTGINVIVTDVSATTPVTLPETPVSPAPYCDANSTIKASQPSDPSAFLVSGYGTEIDASASTPGTVTLTFSSLSGWTGAIDVACPDLPQYTTCAMNPGQVNLSPVTPLNAALPPTQAVLTITTNVPPYVPTANSGFYWLAAVVLGLVLMLARRRFRQFKGGLSIAGFALVLFGGIAGLSGCGSGTTGAASAVTKPGSYPITVVLTGSQKDTYGYNEYFRPDVPYKISFTLVVK